MMCPSWLRPALGIITAVYVTGLPACFLDKVESRLAYVIVVGMLSSLVLLLLHYFLTITHVNNVTEALLSAVHERTAAKEKHLLAAAITSPIQTTHTGLSLATMGAISPRRRIFAEGENSAFVDVDVADGEKWEAQRYSTTNRSQQQQQQRKRFNAQHNQAEGRREPHLNDEELHSRASSCTIEGGEADLHNQVQNMVAETKKKRETILRDLEVSASDQSIFDLQGAAKDLIETCFDLIVHEERKLMQHSNNLDGGGSTSNINNNSFAHTMRSNGGIANLRDLPPGTRVDDLARHSVSKRRLGGSCSGGGGAESSSGHDPSANGGTAAGASSEFALSIGGLSQMNRNPKTILEVPFYIARGQRFQEDSPTICFYIERSKNANIVVYDCHVEVSTISGVLEGSDAIEAAQDDPNPTPLIYNTKLGKYPLHMYWLDKEPSYAAANREKGIHSDRMELNFIEKRLAYGATQEPIPENVVTAPKKGGEEAAAATVASSTTDVLATKGTVSFVALPQRAMQLHMARCHIATTTDGQGCKYPKGAWAPVVTVVINSVLCVAEKVFVKSTESKHFWQMPSVDYIDLYGFSLETDEVRGIEIGMLVVERITS